MEPGLGTIPFRFAMVSVVSVCPKPSMSIMPVACFQLLNTSGLSASPAMQQYFSDDRSWPSSPALMKNLNMVGGQHSVVMWYLHFCKHLITC